MDMGFVEMVSDKTPAPIEEHSKQCLANAVISAVENLRDSEYLELGDFMEAMQDGTILGMARSYLMDSMVGCRC